LLYAKLEVIALYGHKHEANYAPTKRIGSHVNEITTLLMRLVHSYRTEIEVGVNWSKKFSLSKQMNGGDPPSLAI
jgi:hypothetical protein